jgi:phosphatidate cytidylyltransferase
VTDKNRNLAIRVASALMLLPLVLYLLYRGGYWSALLFSLAATACAFEYMTITLKRMPPIGVLALCAAGCLPFFPVWKPADAAALVSGVTGLVLFASWVWHLILGPFEEGPLRTAHILTALVYGAGGLTALSGLRMLDDGGWWVFIVLVVTWGNDTAAYFAGRFLGRHKLYPAVSPNKTWEGFFGGMFGSIAMLFGARAWLFQSLTVLDCVFIGMVGGLLGPAGDLCESMLKRAYGVKDSGNLIPGHGGMLDRIDALIFNAPMVYLYVKFLRPWA